MARIPIPSPTSGILSSQAAEDGALMEEGESIGQVEVMKMFTDVMSPATGRIKWLIGLGECVEYDDILAEIETEG
jgi:biotin carboxyl carrier protein